MPFYTYVLECSNGSLYTGWTNDLDNRLVVHNSGKGAKYTRANRPVKLLASWSFESKKEAMQMEWKIKQLNRPAKEKLIASTNAEKLVSSNGAKKSIASTDTENLPNSVDAEKLIASIDV